MINFSEGVREVVVSTSNTVVRLKCVAGGQLARIEVRANPTANDFDGSITSNVATVLTPSSLFDALLPVANRVYLATLTVDHLAGKVTRFDFATRP